MQLCWRGNILIHINVNLHVTIFEHSNSTWIKTNWRDVREPAVISDFALSLKNQHRGYGVNVL